MKIFLFFWLLPLFCTLHAYQSVEGTTLKNLKNADSVRVEIRQEKFSDLLREKITTDIELIADSHGRIRWQAGIPPKSIAILSKSRLSRFELVEGKWEKVESQADTIILGILKKIAQMTLCDFKECSDDFEITQTPGLVTLIPKNNNLKGSISKIRITLNRKNNTPSEIRIDAPDEDWTILQIIKITENPKNIDAAFDAENPGSFFGKNANLLK